MPEEENIAGELHGHLTQMVRSAMSGGLEISEVRARRRQQVAEAERQRAMADARRLEDRKRAEAETNAVAVQQGTAREERDQAREAERVGEDRKREESGESPEAAGRGDPGGITDRTPSRAERRSRSHAKAKSRHERSRRDTTVRPGVER